MTLETPHFVQLIDINDESRSEKQDWIDRDMPTQIVSRELAAKFHFPTEQIDVIRRIANTGKPVLYNRDGVSFQWLVRGFSSQWLQDPKYPDDPHRKKLVGVIDAILVKMPDDVVFTVTHPVHPSARCY